MKGKGGVKGKRQGGSKENDWYSTFCEWMPFLAIVGVRALGAAVNVIYDCDEVYNYWEPLHYILYKYGKQTWEYSPVYGLRSYLYILLHWVVAQPAKVLAGDGTAKSAVFYAVRLFLGLVCGTLEFALFRAVEKLNRHIARNLFFILILSTGMFCSSTSFLPNTFSMYTLMAASVGVLSRDIKVVIFSAVLGVVVGWCVAGVAFIPFALYVLLQPNLLQWFTVLGTWLLTFTTLLTITDSYFYGKFMVSLWNFVQYNIVGGGQSELYGVEPWHYYIRSGLNNFNIAFLLALALPLVAMVAWLMRIAPLNLAGGKRVTDGVEAGVMVVCAPLFLWLPVISLLPHKEERFLFVVFPQICCAAAVTMSLIHQILLRITSKFRARAVMHCILLTFGTVCAMRTVALRTNYGAPLQVFFHLQQYPIYSNRTGEINVCMGDEWFRFPSSFFLPSPQYRLHYLKQTFSDMLPAPFAAHRGTAVASLALNDKNMEAPSLYLEDIQECDFVIDFEHSKRERLVSHGNISQWETIVNYPFLDASLSPSLYRAFYIPWISKQKNYFGDYKMYRRVSQHNSLDSTVTFPHAN